MVTLLLAQISGIFISSVKMLLSIEGKSYKLSNYSGKEKKIKWRLIFPTFCKIRGKINLSKIFLFLNPWEKIQTVIM